MQENPNKESLEKFETKLRESTESHGTEKINGS